MDTQMTILRYSVLTKYRSRIQPEFRGYFFDWIRCEINIAYFILFGALIDKLLFYTENKTSEGLRLRLTGFKSISIPA